MVLVDFSPERRGSIKGYMKKSSRSTFLDDSSSSEESERYSEAGNSGQGAMVGNTGEDGSNGDEQDVVVVYEEVQEVAVDVEQFDRKLFHIDLCGCPLGFYALQSESYL